MKARFPACRHRRRSPAPDGLLPWLASEPYRVFFWLGAAWSVVGVTLWPLFYQGLLATHPLMSHGRLMIEGFGGAFVVGFLGTAGPRMASAPKLSPAELIGLVALHTGAALSHLRGHQVLGDFLFAALLLSLMACLVFRLRRYRSDPPPPQLLLALTGLVAGTAGAAMLASAASIADPRLYRLANLLLHQGLLLPPVLGIGSFLFPRILGGDFGEAATPEETRKKRHRTLAAMGLLTGSFFLEAYVSNPAGGLLRAAVCLGYLGAEVPWRRQKGQGTLAAGLRASLAVGAIGLILASFADPAQRISVDHLLYIGGFGLLMLVVGSRVLFGHSGQLEQFARASWPARLVVSLALLAAATRSIVALAPQLALSHHQYAALTWAALAILWLVWHRRRFVDRE